MNKSAILRSLCSGLLAATLLSGTALAQSNPTADQIIDALKPTGNVGATTRGIKPIGPGDSSMAPMSSTSSAPQAAAPEASQGVASTNLEIVFASGSTDLTPQAVAVLNQLGEALTNSQLAAYHFKIVGHTDTTGDAATNLSLSQQRAQAVEAYLNSKFGVADARLQATGVGEADLLVQTPPQTPELRNRRVEIINLGQ